ncbi:MAG: hypothetical protein ACTS3F_00810 [Phycisphaerales bacterium]
MTRSTTTATTALAIAALAGAANADFDVIGGQTNVLLDTDTLSSAASLDLSSVSPDVIAPGDLGPASVAFPITDDQTFSYDPGLASFSGAITHTGSVFFNADTVEVGNFTIGFDAARVGGPSGTASGFFVESTVGIAAILFDVENPSAVSADMNGLSITANLLVSPEFGAFLFDNGLSTSNLQGADVGDALVAGVVPAPGALAIAALAGAAATRRRRNA